MKINNPLFQADMPDPDIIRAGACFYMVSTTMYHMPGAPILRSEDLAHWEIVSYICREIADNEIYRMENGRHAYAKGQWATSLMRYRDRFYACFVCHDMKKTYLFSTDDIEKSGWDKTEIDGVFHDMSFLCWQDRLYLVYGNGQIRIVELKEDVSGIVEGTDRVLLQTPTEGMRLCCEGCRAYVKDGRIYLLFIDWPADTTGEAGKRREVCYRLEDLSGAFERRTILYDDMWIPGRGIAQGPLFDDGKGNWYAVMFQDSGAVGRVPFLMNVEWKDGWPVLGKDGKVPETLEVPFEEKQTEEIIQSDSFDHSENRLKNVWQWNHNPDNEAWSFTERTGCLRLKNRTRARELFEARNTLTQRVKAPYSEFLVRLDCGGMEDGDYAGLCVLVERYGQIGVRQKEGRRRIVMRRRKGERAPFAVAGKGMEELKGWYALEEIEAPLEADNVWLKVIFRLDSWGSGEETAEFLYSPDGENYVPLGGSLPLFYSLSLFVGARIGIFSYNEEKDRGGCADFCGFTFRDEEFISPQE